MVWVAGGGDKADFVGPAAAGIRVGFSICISGGGNNV